MDSNTETTPKTIDWSQPDESDLGCLPVLDPKVEEFLSGDKTKDDPTTWECLPEPSFTNSKDWVVWQAEQVTMPSWCPKLASILGQRDIHQLAQLVWASFQMPLACYTATKWLNNYMVPPTPPCLDCDTYLPMKDSRFSLQDFQLKQPQKTLAYAKALQHWADLAKPVLPGESHQLVECIQELRRWMEPFTTFTDAQVFDLVEPSNWV